MEAPPPMTIYSHSPTLQPIYHSLLHYKHCDPHFCTHLRVSSQHFRARNLILQLTPGFSFRLLCAREGTMAVCFGRATGRNGTVPMFQTNVGIGGRSKNGFGVLAFAGSCGLKEEFKTLRLRPGATEKEVKKAYRRLALQFHPDVCKGDNCGVQFEKINEAYQTVLCCLGEANKHKYYKEEESSYVEVMMGDEWEEWMGWEGASGSRDHSNHINIYA